MNSSKTSDSAIWLIWARGSWGPIWGSHRQLPGPCRKASKKVVMGREARRDDADFAGWVYASGIPVGLVL